MTFREDSKVDMRDSLDEDGEDIEIDGRTTFQFIEKVGKRKVKAFFNNSPLNLELIETPFNTNNPFVQVHPDDVSNLKPHLGATHPTAKIDGILYNIIAIRTDPNDFTALELSKD